MSILGQVILNHMESSKQFISSTFSYARILAPIFLLSFLHCGLGMNVVRKLPSKLRIWNAFIISSYSFIGN